MLNQLKKFFQITLKADPSDINTIIAKSEARLEVIDGRIANIRNFQQNRNNLEPLALSIDSSYDPVKIEQDLECLTQKSNVLKAILVFLENKTNTHSIDKDEFNMSYNAFCLVLTQNPQYSTGLLRSQVDQLVAEVHIAKNYIEKNLENPKKSARNI